jgi:hypothetical protein
LIWKEIVFEIFNISENSIISVELVKVPGLIATTRFEHFDQSNSLANNQKQGAINNCVHQSVPELSKLPTFSGVIAVVQWILA